MKIVDRVRRRPHGAAGIGARSIEDVEELPVENSAIDLMPKANPRDSFGRDF
jgi:hypothetical protein